MENAATVGWIAAIVIGGIAGWLAEQFMKSNLGLLTPPDGSGASLGSQTEPSMPD